ncbi:DUF6439 family protein [Spirulina sp. CCNP1310]|uniref:DUF6439 family protein n=1 Tax=Spirulina sp. CCNP1310 TaxID=3110249 RepID=UPI002B1FB970|nr:DUF6439 family protein [Spirulina sp. CCNP1310]MEA5420439.1 DUF6439 family protein [Spirulina sp. CCNP1310]
MIPASSLNNTLHSSTQTPLALAQALAAQLAIAPNDWHRLKGDRRAQAQQQITAALVFLLNDQPQEALTHLQQAVGWLDRSLKAPPCPTHGSPTQISLKD